MKISRLKEIIRENNFDSFGYVLVDGHRLVVESDDMKNLMGIEENLEWYDYCVMMKNLLDLGDDVEIPFDRFGVSMPSGYYEDALPTYWFGECDVIDEKDIYCA